MIIAIDFETISTKSLKDCGTFRYLQDPSTAITLMSICKFDVVETLNFIKGKDYQTIEDYLFAKTDVIELYKDLGTDKKITDFFPEDESYHLLAHNRDFELHAKYNGWMLKDILPKSCKVYDTMIMARRLSLPNSLDKLSGLFGVHKKDTRLLNKFSIGLKLNEFLEKTKTPEYEKFKEYCRYDTISTVNIFLNLLLKYPNTTTEIENLILRASDKINERGIPVDLEEVKKAKKLLNELSEKNSKRCMQKFGMLPTQVLKIKDYINERSPIKIDSSDRKALTNFIENSTDEDLKELARLRLESSSSSTKKLDKMIHAEWNGRVRGAFQYYKAHTGRWSATLIQPQNMPRGKQDEEFFNILHELEETSETEIKNNLRGFIKAPKDHTFIIADYRQIEFRLLLYVAQDKENMKKVRDGADLYKELASSIYGVPLDKVTKDQRQLGKIVTLGAGYGLGSVGLERILKGYGLEGIDCKKAIEEFRKKYFKIKDLWYLFDDMAVEGSGIFKRYKDRLELTLPSKRVLYYHNPSRVLEELDGWIKTSYKFFNGEETEYFYGGKFVENYIQAVARDLLGLALVRADMLGLKPILHVHDEIVVESEIKRVERDMKILTLCMTKPPEWFDKKHSFLLDVELASSERYTK